MKADSNFDGHVSYEDFYEIMIRNINWLTYSSSSSLL